MNVTLHHVPSCHPELVEGATIAVLEYEARRPRDVTLVVGHGYSSSKQNLDGLCAFLASQGFGIYSLDFPGHKLGASTGHLRDTDHLVETMSTVVTFARGRGAKTVYTLGHSMGAATALCTAGRDPSIAGAISIATGWGRPSVLDGLATRGVVDLRSSYVDGPSLPELAQQWDARLAPALEQLAGRPALFVAAERDGMVARASVQELFERAAEPKTFVTVPSDHTFAGDNSRTTVLQWLNPLHPRAAKAEVLQTPLIDAPL